jgi:hypothetical protein
MSEWIRYSEKFFGANAFPCRWYQFTTIFITYTFVFAQSSVFGADFVPSTPFQWFTGVD